ncbi:MAG: PEPxxWA-CTERM sorting domain-containing protein [Phenylobacterium sp.]|nr:PEPxxWA-CTERM sorting domain-containing protein [Phenylobacterium sp.]
MRFDVLKGAAVSLALAFAPCGAQAATNLVTNGSFETGAFDGWATNPVSYPQTIVSHTVQDGAYAAQIEGYAYGPNTLSQLIATTSGQSYTLSFWYNAVGKSANGFNVTWNGATVFSVTNQMTSGFQHITANVLGSGSDALVFTAYNEVYNTMLDNVSVSAVASAVPEPATWAMMIIGFGATGVMIRASRRRTVAA